MISETRLIVRYAETDQMGIVHHSVYAVWFEAARTDFLNQAGMSYGKMEKEGLFLPVFELNCKFKSPAHYEEEILIRTKITKMTYSKIFFAYEVLRAADLRLLAEGSTVHAFTDKTPRAVNFAKTAPELYRAISGLVENN